MFIFMTDLEESKIYICTHFAEYTQKGSDTNFTLVELS